MDWLPIISLLVPTLPLAAAILTAILGPRVLGKQSHLPTIVALIISFFCSLYLLQQVGVMQDGEAGFERVYSLWTWADVDDAMTTSDGATVDFSIDVTLRLDALTAIMLAMVTFVSSLVAIYAAGYMHNDRGYWRFFSYISLFVFSMTMLVSVSNFLLLYVFWEAVGVCSYLLIGFWYQKPEAAEAGKKAFLVNRVGDFGFALALFLIWTSYGTLNFHSADSVEPIASASSNRAIETEAVGSTVDGVLSKQRLEKNEFVGLAGSGNELVALAICLLLMVGACGKSAQIPLHVWLPDAMEGPTPVSALIHAATMVTAGVYMVVRCTPLFMVSPDAQLVVACIGGATAIMAGLIAMTQFDLKRVLAYSTISQLGYMFLALGTGTMAGISAGMFHLFTHAFFKALLFLGAGSVMHAMGNVIDMRKFGGLRKVMPITHATFLVGCLALAGFPLLSGFWSKDAVIASVHDKAHDLQAHTEHADGGDHHGAESHASPAWHATTYRVLEWTAMFTALLTAIYTFRAYFMTFWGQKQIPDEAHGHAHESPWSMCGPLVVLAFCAAFVGVMLDHTSYAKPDLKLTEKHGFSGYLVHAPSLAYGTVTETHPPGEFHPSVAFTSGVIAIVGIGLAFSFYIAGSRELQGVTQFMQLNWTSGWLRAISPYHLSARKFYFDEIYSVTTVWPLRIMATISYWWDRWIVDGLVNTVGRVPLWAGSIMRPMHMGLVPFYALAMVIGLLILLITRYSMIFMFA